MDTLLYLLARLVIGALQALPLRWVARIGRGGGALFYWVDARHRKVAAKNMALCLPEKTSEEIRELVRENFRRIGEAFACAAKTASMTAQQLERHITFVGAEKILGHNRDGASRSVVVAIGHFGNFELYARFGHYAPGFVCATTYRALRQPALNRLMQSLREKSGTRFFERRKDGAALKATMSGERVLLGLLGDQHAGDAGLKLPFFGRDCSTSAAPAVFALRYDCPLHTGFCYRTGIATWRMEAGDEIPTRINGEPRSSLDIMRDVNRAYEAAIRRDPANWFWVHNRWKAGKWRERVATVQDDPANGETEPSPQ